MHLQTAVIRNFRRLERVQIDLSRETSIFVGANNSGKTSATHVFKKFLSGTKPTFSLHDFSAKVWETFDALVASQDPTSADIPAIELDLWFTIDRSDIHRVVPLLPGLSWRDEPMGIRFSYSPDDPAGLVTRFREAAAAPAEQAPETTDPKPWPTTMCDYLRRRMEREFGTRYSVLKRADFDDDLELIDGRKLTPLADGPGFVRSLIRFDSMDAQRHLSDAKDGKGAGLTGRLGNFYKRNLEQREGGAEAQLALARSENSMNEHFATVFHETMARLETIVFAGAQVPRLVVRADLNSEHGLDPRATVHYELQAGEAEEGGSPRFTMPDEYNGLGYKNLIFMVLELLDYEIRWQRMEGQRPLLHIVAIEEPEAHLHAQLQQVFITRVRELLRTDDGFTCQMIVTTHSPQIVYHGFEDVRYFRRLRLGDTAGYTDVLSLSNFHTDEPTTRDFIRKYLKLTHCDLFFADAVVLVEGNVERLLVPMIIEREVPALQRVYLSVLEVGGAFAHRFRELVDFLGLPTLIVTDIDSGNPPYPDGATAAEKELLPSPRSACPTNTPGAQTTNPTLAEWLPKMDHISELIVATPEQRTIDEGGDRAAVHVAYQMPVAVEWNGESAQITGRTLEEAFALENLAWSQDPAQSSLGLRISGTGHSLAHVTEAIHKRIANGNVDKTAFALGLLMLDSSPWKAPGYIRDGLEWLTAVAERGRDAAVTEDLA